MQSALDRLRAMTAPIARVVRDGVLEALSIKEIVPGDVVAVTEGDVVPPPASSVRKEARPVTCRLAHGIGDRTPCLRATGFGCPHSTRSGRPIRLFPVPAASLCLRFWLWPEERLRP